MSYIISEDGKELLKDVRDFCINEVKEQVKEYDISGEWPKEIYDQAIEMQLHMMDVPEEMKSRKRNAAISSSMVALVPLP